MKNAGQTLHKNRGKTKEKNIKLLQHWNVFILHFLSSSFTVITGWASLVLVQKSQLHLFSSEKKWQELWGLNGCFSFVVLTCLAGINNGRFLNLRLSPLIPLTWDQMPPLRRPKRSLQERQSVSLSHLATCACIHEVPLSDSVTTYPRGRDEREKLHKAPQ